MRKQAFQKFKLTKIIIISSEKIRIIRVKLKLSILNDIYVVIILPNIPTLPNGGVIKWIDNIGYVLLNSIELEIGGK